MKTKNNYSIELRRDLGRFIPMLFVILIIITSCSPSGFAPDSSPTASPISMTETINATATKAETPVPTETPTSAIKIPEVAQQFVTTSRIFFDNWSADSQWISYWFKDIEGGPVYLGIVNTETGIICKHQEINEESFSTWRVTWQADNEMIYAINSDGRTLSGKPCETFVPMDNIKNQPDSGHTSPDGKYRVDTTVLEWEGSLIHNKTTITEISTGEAVLSVKWDGSPHFQNQSGWLNRDLFLIGTTVDQGVVYASVSERKVGNVIIDLFKLPAGEIGKVYSVSFNANMTSESFHLLLEQPEKSPDSPLLLYHSELDLVETLPFYLTASFGPSSQFSSFSPGGQYVLLVDPLGGDFGSQGKGSDYWLREVDPPESSAFKVAENAGFGGISFYRNLVAYNEKGNLKISNYENGTVIGQWKTPGCILDPRYWFWPSDGAKFAGIVDCTGRNTTHKEALFIVKLPAQTSQADITELPNSELFTISAEIAPNVSQEQIAEILYTKWLDQFRSDDIGAEIRLTAYTIDEIIIPVDQRCAGKLGGSFVTEAQVTFQTFLPQASMKDEPRSEFFTAGGGNIIDAYTQSRIFSGIVSQSKNIYTLTITTRIPMCE